VLFALCLLPFVPDPFSLVSIQALHHPERDSCAAKEAVYNWSGQKLSSEVAMPGIRYEHVHQNRFTVTDAKNIGDFIHMLEENLNLFKRWQDKGIQVDPHGVGSSYAIFYTYDERVAREEGFDRIRTEAGNPLPLKKA
jgi:hypothetical protein